MTGSPGEAHHVGHSTAGPRARRPGAFKTGVTLLVLSAFAYGFLEFTGEGQSGVLKMTVGTSVLAAMYGAFVLWVVSGSQHARTAMLNAVIVMCTCRLIWVHGIEGLAAYSVALVTSIVGMVLLYVPKSKSYIAARESYIAGLQVRRLFEERGKDGERLHIVYGIADILGMSPKAVYLHLDVDQRRQPPRSLDDG
ncbi:hypothetical protein [Actinomadura sp. 9N407]|uniref:hypothetical protein n=1 Tax=Actinomadura sp. 9N407 TaxID=3375154 RepID=UPI0037B8E4D3